VVLCPDPTAVFFGSSYFNHRKTEYALLHCVGLYPTKNENVNNINHGPS
jgi:sialic acid synthase SpsE